MNNIDLDGSLTGESDRLYRRWAASGLEPQIWPDASGRADFPSAGFTPDIIYRFAAAGCGR